MWSRGWYLYLNSNGGLQLGFVKTTVVTICSTGPRTGRGSVCCSARHEAPQVPGRGKSPKKYLLYKKNICFIILAFAKVNWKYWSAVPICQHIATNSFTDQTEQVSNENAKEGQLLDWHQSRGREGQNVNGTHLQVNCWDIKCYDHIPHLWFITTLQNWKDKDNDIVCTHIM